MLFQRHAFAAVDAMAHDVNRATNGAGKGDVVTVITICRVAVGASVLQGKRNEI